MARTTAAGVGALAPVVQGAARLAADRRGRAPPVPPEPSSPGPGSSLGQRVTIRTEPRIGPGVWESAGADAWPSQVCRLPAEHEPIFGALRRVGPLARPRRSRSAGTDHRPAPRGVLRDPIVMKHAPGEDHGACISQSIPRRGSAACALPRGSRPGPPRDWRRAAITPGGPTPGQRKIGDRDPLIGASHRRRSCRRPRTRGRLPCRSSPASCPEPTAWMNRKDGPETSGSTAARR